MLFVISKVYFYHPYCSVKSRKNIHL